MDIRSMDSTLCEHARLYVSYDTKNVHKMGSALCKHTRTYVYIMHIYNRDSAWCERARRFWATLDGSRCDGSASVIATYIYTYIYIYIERERLLCY